MKQKTKKQAVIVKAKTRSIIKDSDTIRRSLLKRWEELQKVPNDILLDARNRGMKFTFANLSKYMNHGNVKNSLTEESIVWLCIRYGIPIKLLVGKPTLDPTGKKLVMVEEPYNEKKCLENLNQIFKK